MATRPFNKQFGAVTQLPTPKLTAAPVFVSENIRSIVSGPAFGGHQMPNRQNVTNNLPKKKKYL